MRALGAVDAGSFMRVASCGWLHAGGFMREAARTARSVLAFFEGAFLGA